MKFGEIKSKIENKLTSSFRLKTIKEDVKFFKKNILSDDSFNKLMIGYDKLKEQKGMDKESSEMYVNELYSELKDLKLKKSTINSINEWVENIVCENEYKEIDNFIYSTIDEIENKVKAKKSIIENTCSKKIQKESIKVPISTMLKVANKNIVTYLEKLNESDKEKVLKVLKLGDEGNNEFNTLKEETIGKINKLIEESEGDLKQTLSETKEKITNTNFSKSEFIKLLSLNESLK
jgi:hypothetical protein